MLCTNKQNGFSLAEMLIVMVILIFVALATVPLLGSQKMKKPPAMKRNHGIVECFYGADGQLHRYEKNNSNNKKGTYEVVTTDYCEFQPPQADFYTIQTIGPGGDGPTQIPTYSYTHTKNEESVSIGNNFASSLAAAPSWVSEHWNKQWTLGAPLPTFTISASGGKGGDAVCKDFLQGGKPGCIGCSMAEEGCVESGCIEWRAADGGASGPGSVFRVSRALYVGDSVSGGSSAGGASLTIGKESVTIPGGTSGGDGSWNGNVAIHGSNGSQIGSFSNSFSPPFSYYVTSPGAGGSGCSSSGAGGQGFSSGSGTGATGGFSVSPSSIPYSSNLLTVNAQYGTSGEAGKYMINVFEKLPGIKLRLHPGTEMFDPTTIHAISENGEATEIFASEQANYGTMEMATFLANEGNVFPFPNNFSFEPNVPASSIAPSNMGSKLVDAINAGYIPGRSGVGSFPILYIDDGQDDYVINGKTVHTYFYKEGIKEKNFNPATVNCKEGMSPVKTSTYYYCPSTKGKAGAIVISW